jgi:hypothetical protein
VYESNCTLQIGVAAASPEDGSAVNVDAEKFIRGSLYTSANESKKRECLLLFRSFMFVFRNFIVAFLQNLI